MPESSGPKQLHEEPQRVLAERFGVDRGTIEELAFIDRRDEIWACRSLPPEGIASERPSGLRAFRRQADGLKPTSTFLIALGDRITASRAALEPRDLERVLLGQRIPAPVGLTDGYVALCFREDILGCGKVRNGTLHGLIPTGRRRELLGALATDPRT